MEVSYERASSPPNSRRSSGASTTGMTPQRKNSITGTTALPYSACDSSTEAYANRFNARHRSPSPSIRYALREKDINLHIFLLNRCENSIKRRGNIFRVVKLVRCMQMTLDWINADVCYSGLIPDPWVAALFSSDRDLVATVPIIHTITDKLHRRLLTNKKVMQLFLLLHKGAQMWLNLAKMGLDKVSGFKSVKSVSRSHLNLGNGLWCFGRHSLRGNWYMLHLTDFSQLLVH